MRTLSASQCRKPSRMPDSVEEADGSFSCRQMKLVQHMLNGLTDSRTHMVDQNELMEQGATEDDSRRQAFFGRYWSTIEQIDCLNTAEKLNRFENVLRSAFPKMMAVLIASTLPSDRTDAENAEFGIGEEWHWELPREYIDNLPEEISDQGYQAILDWRAEMMRRDVNEWIRKCGIHVFADAGSGDDIMEGKFRGDYDFMLMEITHFMYIFKDYPELLNDESIWTLISKDWQDKKMDFAEDPYLAECRHSLLRPRP